MMAACKERCHLQPDWSAEVFLQVRRKRAVSNDIKRGRRADATYGAQMGRTVRHFRNPKLIHGILLQIGGGHRRICDGSRKHHVAFGRTRGNSSLGCLCNSEKPPT